ncbi:hypothetical protein H634G_03353 [Metarhizium anisopliae BRIP 53293]|uniref:Uncharacterized protein n=1 Tax=Metarhizium anisopliae BRIP 53293 TaxID=1291518 RepID=A0A0D9P554_METAN|nr:hypothetical protein H634G_03353 [Metarhizium anisopliae BRIP 53293]KJK93812.1 hypothetical protein H633G_02315 [Metarhizium anisopliae BRIP 53284]
MKIPQSIALVGFTYAATAWASLGALESSIRQVNGQIGQLEDVTNKHSPILDGDKSSTFFVGDFRDPTVVFREGLQPGFDTGLDDAAVATTPEDVFVSPSHEASIDMSFFQQESEAQTGFVYQVTLHGLPQGHWLHDTNRNDAEETADLFVVPAAIPPKNIQGVYIYHKDGSGLPVKTKWIPNKNPSDPPRPRKRQTKKPCVPIDPNDVDPEDDDTPVVDEDGTVQEPKDPRCFTNYHGSVKDRERDKKKRKKPGSSWRRRNCLDASEM